MLKVDNLIIKKHHYIKTVIRNIRLAVEKVKANNLKKKI